MGMVENKSTRLKTALFNRGSKVRTFALISAENPLNIQATAEENNKYTNKMKEYLKKMALNYIQVEGMYNRSERSFMIVNLAFSDAEFLASTFQQESFFFGSINGIYYYELDESTGKYTVIDKAREVNTMQDAENFFTRHGDYKFSIYLDYFNEALDIPDDYELDISLDDSRTPFGRFLHRKRIYKK